MQNQNNYSIPVNSIAESLVFEKTVHLQCAPIVLGCLALIVFGELISPDLSPDKLAAVCRRLDDMGYDFAMHLLTNDKDFREMVVKLYDEAEASASGNVMWGPFVSELTCFSLHVFNGLAGLNKLKSSHISRTEEVAIEARSDLESPTNVASEIIDLLRPIKDFPKGGKGVHKGPLFVRR